MEFYVEMCTIYIKNERASSFHATHASLSQEVFIIDILMNNNFDFQHRPI